MVCWCLFVTHSLKLSWMKLPWAFFVHVFLWTYALTSLDKYLGVKLLVHRKIAHWALVDTAEQFSKVLVAFSTLSPPPHPPAKICIIPVGLSSCQHLVVSVHNLSHPWVAQGPSVVITLSQEVFFFHVYKNYLGCSFKMWIQGSQLIPRRFWFSGSGLSSEICTMNKHTLLLRKYSVKCWFNNPLLCNLWVSVVLAFL